MDGIYMAELLLPEETREILRETGAGVELLRFGVSENLDNLEEHLEIAKRELAFWGDPDITLHGPFLDLNPASYEPLVREATRLRFEQCYEAAKALGAGKIVFHSCRIPQTVYLEGWAERMADFWNRFLDGKNGITVCMENVFEPEYEGILEVAERVEHPDFGLCLDLGHVHCFSDRPLSEWVQALKSHIRHVHVHDNDGSRDAHLALGAGTVPAAEAVRELKEIPDITWTVECGAVGDMKESIRMMKKML